MVRMSDVVRGQAAQPAGPSAPEDGAPADVSTANEEPESAPAPRVDLQALIAPTPVPPPPSVVPAPPPPEPPPAQPAPPPAPPAPAPASSAAAADIPALQPTAETGADSPPPAQVFSRLCAIVERSRGFVASRDPFPWGLLTRVIERCVLALGSSAELFWLANAPAGPTGTDPVAVHQARVAVLALRIGANVGLERQALVELGVAACVIDVGLWAPGSAGRRLDPDSADYRAHPRVSADIVTRWTPPFPSIVEAVRGHHEREQGQGYPEGLRGDAIHWHAKVIGLADRYAALTSATAGRTAGRPHDAIRLIVRSKSDDFPPALIKALLTEISLFPPGTPVTLNTGEFARVIGVNRDHPLRPRVEVLADGRGRGTTPARVIDLVEAPFVYITGPATEHR
jgi:hypothetical protein